VTGSPGTASGVPPTNGPSRPSIAERAARRDELQAAGRDRYGTLLRSLQAGHELPLHRRGGRIAIDWNPVLWTLFKVAIVVVAVYFTVRLGTQWWRENHVDTWSGPDATVQSGVSLAGCPVVADIRVEDFPSWVSYGGSIYNYTPWKRPYINAQTPGYTMTPYTNGTMHLVTIENTPDGVARDTIMIWLEGAMAGVEYARAPDCAAP
jgi:hypothetical protein